MIEVRDFRGKLNIDDNDYRVPKGDYTDALNITRDAQGDGQDMVVSTIVGNQSALYFRSTNVLTPNSPIPINNLLYITFAGCPFPNTSIEIFLFDGLVSRLVTRYVTVVHDTIPIILTNLQANVTSLPWLGTSIVGSDTFLVSYDNTIYFDSNVYISQVISYAQNKVIGNFSDKVRNREYFFTWNSVGYDKICYYDGTTSEVILVMEDRTYTENQSVQVLNFNPSWRINHIDIIYRDEDGDLLFWTEGLNPPSKINVKTALTNGYGPIKRSYLDVAKEPPATPPICVYEDNPSSTVNNLNNKLFKFKYRFVYDDFEKSVTSAQSYVPIPKNYSNQTVATNPTKNSSIFILLDSGAENVKKIEILGSESLGTTWSDFFLITVLDKSILSIPSNNTAQFKFFNDQAYSIIPLNESIQPFDAVPQKAYTQSLPNGSVLDYGAITENYNLVNGNYIAEVNPTLLNFRDTGPTALVQTYAVVDSYYGNALKIVIAGIPASGETYTGSYIENGIIKTWSVISFGNTTGYLNTLIFNYFNGLGYFVASDSDNNLIITKSGSTFNLYLPNQSRTNRSNDKDSKFAYDWFSRYSYGVVYFDEKGRTNGVVNTINSSVQTDQYRELIAGPEPDIYIPNQKLSIYSRPPKWATYFEIVRTKNLTKSNFLYWVSYATFKDSLPNQLGNQYAYISISNLTNYLIDNPTIKTISYEFSPGDRIRFVKLYDGQGNTVQIYGNTDNRDYQILEVVTNPLVNAIQVPGQVIKILLPTNLGTPFNFGGDAYSNYLIELYTPAVSLSNNNNLYYEFGEKYQIGNAGIELLAFHYGKNGNQSENLNIPAVFNLYKGDSFFRLRQYPVEGIMRWKSEAFTGSNAYHLNSTLYSNTNNNPYITPQPRIDLAQAGQSQPPNLFAILINPTKVFTFFIKGTIVVVSNSNSQPLTLSTSTSAGFSGYSVASNFTSAPLVGGVETTINYTLQITNLVGDTNLDHRIGFIPGGGVRLTGTIRSWIFDITINNGINQGIIDPNFSDTYDSSASPNGRAWAFDPNASQSFNPALIRFGGEFQANTIVNNVNRFYDDNFDIYDRSRGSIKKMFIEGRNQYIFQEFDVGVVTILTQMVRDTAGNPLSAESDRLLNKVVYPYTGGYGIGNVPESFAYGKRAKYFVDNNKGVVCRLSTDGITPLSILYKANAFFVAKTAGFKENLNTNIPVGGTPTIYGGFDAYTNKYIIAMSEIDREDFYQEPYTLSFLESRDSTEGFESFLSFHPENMGALNNLFITFLNGGVWTHNNSTHCNFYLDQYSSYISAIFNDNPLDKKSYLAIMQTGNNVWYCPSIKSQLNSYGSTPQESSLSAARFKLLEGQYNSAILRDANSAGGIINGDTMKGNYLIVKFQIDNASSFYYINTVSLKYNNSPLNTR